MNVTLLKKQFTTGGAALYLFAAFGGTSLAQTAGTNLLTGATNVTRLPDVIVTGRQDSLLGIADSANQGTTGAAQLAERPILRSGEILETILQEKLWKSPTNNAICGHCFNLICSQRCPLVICTCTFSRVDHIGYRSCSIPPVESVLYLVSIRIGC